MSMMDCDFSDLIFRCPVTEEIVEIDRDTLATDSCYEHGADGTLMVCCPSCQDSHPLDEMRKQGL